MVVAVTNVTPSALQPTVFVWQEGGWDVARGSIKVGFSIQKWEPQGAAREPRTRQYHGLAEMGIEKFGIARGHFVGLNTRDVDLDRGREDEVWLVHEILNLEVLCVLSLR